MNIMNITNITEISNLTFENFDPDDGNAENKFQPNVQYGIVRKNQICQTATIELVQVLIGIQTIIVLCCIIMQYSRTKLLIRAVFRSMVRSCYEFYSYFIYAFFIRRMEHTPDDPEFKGFDRFSVVETRDIGTSPLCSADEFSFRATY